MVIIFLFIDISFLFLWVEFIFFCLILWKLGFFFIFFFDIEERFFFVVDLRLGKIRLRRSNEGVVLLSEGCSIVVLEFVFLFCICDGFIIVFCVVGWVFCLMFVREVFVFVGFFVDVIVWFFFWLLGVLVLLVFFLSKVNFFDNGFFLLFNWFCEIGVIFLFDFLFNLFFSVFVDVLFFVVVFGRERVIEIIVGLIRDFRCDLVVVVEEDNNVFDVVDLLFFCFVDEFVFNDFKDFVV